MPNNPVTGAIVDRHARTVDALATEQANDLIRRTDVVQGWVTMNRAVRTAVGPDSIAPGATGTVRPDVTVVYQTRDLRWHVRVFEVPSPGQGDAFVRQQRRLAQDSLLSSIIWDDVPDDGMVNLLPLP